MVGSCAMAFERYDRLVCFRRMIISIVILNEIGHSVHVLFP